MAKRCYKYSASRKLGMMLSQQPSLQEQLITLSIEAYLEISLATLLQLMSYID